LFPKEEQKEEGDVPASPQSTLSAIEHQETRNAPRRIIGQIDCTNNPVTEAREIVENLGRGHGGEAEARACFQNVIVDMIRSIRDAYLAGEGTHIAG
jgi:hypothetical protein